MNSKKQSKTDWKRVDATPDEEIDLSDSPEMGADWFRRAKVVLPKPKQRITIRLDADLVDFFRHKAEDEGGHYQTWINAVLREYVEKGPKRIKKGRGKSA